MELAFLIVAILYVIVRAVDIGLVVAFRVMDRDRNDATTRFYEATVREIERRMRNQDVVKENEERELIRLIYEQQLHEVLQSKKYREKG
jgi:hypothetical protein